MLTKEKFISLINTIREEEGILRKIEDFIGQFNSSYTVLNTPPCQLALIELIKEELRDETDLLEWWLYEDVEKVIHLNNEEKYYLDSEEDVYDYLTIIEHPEDDCAYYITKKFLKDEDINLKEWDYPQDEQKLYMYICEEIDFVVQDVYKRLDMTKHKNSNLLNELLALQKEVKGYKEKEE